MNDYMKTFDHTRNIAIEIADIRRMSARPRPVSSIQIGSMKQSHILLGIAFGRVQLSYSIHNGQSHGLAVLSSIS